MLNINARPSRVAEFKELYKHVKTQQDFNVYMADLTNAFNQEELLLDELEEFFLDILDARMLGRFTKQAIKIRGYQPILCWIYALIHYEAEEQNKKKQAKKDKIESQIHEIKNVEHLANFSKHHNLPTDITNEGKYKNG